MPRQRMIKPEFFDSDSLAECSIPARLTFIGLWVMGDDYGNQKANISKLKRNIYPCDEMPDSEFASHLIELERVGCIKGYQADGDVFINVPNFEVYQTVKRPSKPRIPQPSERVKKAKRTKVLEQWINSGGIVGEDSPTSVEHVGEEWDTHPLLTHYSPTTHPQKKEVSKEVLPSRESSSSSGNNSSTITASTTTAITSQYDTALVDDEIVPEPPGFERFYAHALNAYNGLMGTAYTALPGDARRGLAEAFKAGHTDEDTDSVLSVVASWEPKYRTPNAAFADGKYEQWLFKEGGRDDFSDADEIFG